MIKNLENKMEKTQESINKDLEELKNKHTETNSTNTKIKNTLEGINSRISEAEEGISELEDKMVEIKSEEQNKVKRLKRTENSLRDLWDNIKCANIQIIRVPEVAQLYPTLCNPMDHSLPGSSVHGIFQAIVLEWIAISFSRGSSQPRDRTWVSRIVDRCFTI